METRDDQSECRRQSDGLPVQKASTPSTAGFFRSFFLLGILVEVVLLAVAAFLPDGPLLVEIRNLIVMVHRPVLLALNTAKDALMAVLVLLLALGASGTIWGLLICSVSRLIKRSFKSASPRQKRFVKMGFCLCSLVLVAWVVALNLPASPISFTPSPEVVAVVEGNNSFALDLYQKLKGRPGNVFFSPFNVFTALSMTSAGARGETEMEMTNILHLSLTREKLPPAFKTMLERMDKIQRWNRIVLKSANSLWCQKDFPLKTEFSHLVEENYFAETKLVDFKRAPSAVAEEINGWVGRKTSGRISAIADARRLTPSTRLALCHAIYFSGKWLHPFKAHDTKPAPFHISTNQTVRASMMNQKGHFKTAQSDDFSVELLEIPYIGSDLSMVILLPQKRDSAPESEQSELLDLEDKLTTENLRLWMAEIDAAREQECLVSLPRFTVTQTFDLVPELKSMGLKSAFSEAANFAGMDGATNLFISDVMHKASVEVNESGTVAVAATLVTVPTKSKNGRFIVDHPFVFLIREKGSGSIVFLGRIVDPTK